MIERLKKNWVLVLILGVSALVIIGGGIWIWIGTSQKDAAVYKETQVEYGTLTAGVTENGSLAIGENTQSFDLSLSTSSASVSNNSTQGGMEQQMGGTVSVTTTSGTATLEVEEVYVAVGETIAEGDDLLKVTQASLAAARADLAGTVESAELALKDAKINRDIAKTEADYDYKANKALGSTAKSDYNATITMLSQTVANAQAALDQADARLSAIPGEIAALEAARDATDPADTAAIDSFNAQIAQLEKEKSQIESNYSTLKAKLTQAKNKKSTESIVAKQTYETALLTYENASTIYQMALSGIDDDVETAQDDLDAAQENLAEFDSYLSGSVIKAEYGGIVTTVGYEAGDTLSADTAIAAFMDADAVTLVVTVTEEDIYAVNIGDSVEIQLAAYAGETFSGTVEEIATTAGNSSTVSYSVTVKVLSNTEKLYSGMTGDVTFITKQVKDVLYVSNKAVTQEGTKTYLLIENEDGSKEKRQVVTGFSDGVNVEVASGAVEGEIALIESKVSEE